MIDARPFPGVYPDPAVRNWMEIFGRRKVVISSLIGECSHVPLAAGHPHVHKLQNKTLRTYITQLASINAYKIAELKPETPSIVRCTCRAKYPFGPHARCEAKHKAETRTGSGVHGFELRPHSLHRHCID